MRSHLTRQAEIPSVYTGDAKGKNRQPRIVLSEEEYSSTLSSIISKDYFPAIPSLRRDASILKRRAEGDISGAVAIRRAARKLAVHEQALEEQEIKDEQEAELNGGIRKHARPLDRETVEGFHARVTSEDNAEFESVMKRERQEKRERIALIYNTSGSEAKNVPLLLAKQQCFNDEVTLEKRKDRGDILNETPSMASDYYNEKVEPTHAPGTTKDGKNISDYNSLFFTPQHYTSPETRVIPNIPSNTVLHQSEGDIPFDGMPPPRPITNGDNSEPTIPHSKGTMQLRDHIGTHGKISLESCKKMQLVEYVAKATSLSREKQIIPLNTRFSYQNESRLVTSSCHETALSTDNNQENHTYETDATTDLDASPRSLGVERIAREELLKRNRNNYVAMTPLIIPGQSGGGPAGREDDCSPIVTWGNIASTPLVVKVHDQSSTECSMENPHSAQTEDLASQTCYQPFMLPSEDATENIARVASQHLAMQSLRCKEAGKTHLHHEASTDTNKSSMLERTSSLTPSVKSMRRKSKDKSALRTPGTRSISSKLSARSSSALGSALRSSYTPKVSRHRSKLRNSSKRKTTEQKATPLLSRKVSKIIPSNIVASLNHKEDTRESIGERCNDLTGGLLKL